MKWRCEWCGKPHEENDPPCDNCGHGSFEEAVVRGAPDGDSENSTIVWVCTDCGREHTKNSPPCSRCGNAKLERTEKVVTDENLTARPGEEWSGSSISAEETTVWVCPDCGREHTKNNPPCSRCGNAKLEQQTKTVSDAEIATPSYFDLLTPAYAAVLGVVLMIAVAFVLGATGVVNLPFFPDDSVPEVEDVPGDETEAATGLSLAEVEAAYVASLNEQRQQNGLDPLERTDRLDEITTFDNQQRIKAELEGTTVDESTVEDLLRDEGCRVVSAQTLTRTVESGMTPAQVSDQFAALIGTGVGESPNETTFDSIGIDVHAVDNELYLRFILCAT